jgi:hypothetical protein
MLRQTQAESKKQIASLTPEKTQQLTKLNSDLEKSRDQAKKKLTTNATNDKKKIVKPAPAMLTPAKKDVINQLDKLAAKDPNFAATAEKIRDGKPLTKQDIANLKAAAGMTTDPKTKGELLKAAGLGNRLTPKATQSTLSLLQNPNTPQNVKNVLNKYLSGQPLTLADKQILDNYKLTGKLSPADQTALAQIENSATVNNVNGTANGLLAGALAAGIGGFTPLLPDLGSGALLAGGSDLFAPIGDTAGFIPSDDLAGDFDPDTIMPNSPGTYVGISPNYPISYADGSASEAPPGVYSPGGEDAPPADLFLSDVGSLASDTMVPQTTRYLRLGNGADKPITFFVQYYSDDDGKFVPADPIERTVEPGDMLDLVVDGWRVNAPRARVWAKSADRTWENFKDKDLPIVPEMEDGKAGYLAPDIGVFNFTLR